MCCSHYISRACVDYPLSNTRNWDFPCSFKCSVFTLSWNLTISLHHQKSCLHSFFHFQNLEWNSFLSILPWACWMIGSRALLKSILLLLLFCNQASKKLTFFFFLLGCFQGVETTRHFLLEWLSYAHRYIPVGLLEVIPQQLNWRPPNYFGRNDLETLMASDSAADWVWTSWMHPNFNV